MGDTPSSISTREQFARALVALREEQSLTIRQVVERSGGSLATVGGWYSGRHVPTPQNSDAFFALLVACGVEDDTERAQWWDAVLRVRKPVARRPDETPYKGLDSFEPEDSDWFFGRDAVVSDLLARVDAARSGDGPRVIVVTGASGSGKSSLLRAGLVAALDVEAVLTRPSLPLPTGDAPVLIVDQAEELWSPEFGGDERSDYFERLSAVDVVVIGLRADFYAAALAEPFLLRALSAGPLVVGPMSADDMRQAITGPARKAGASVDDALVDVLLTDLVPAGSTFASEPGILPLLSHALLGTWQRASTPTLTVADYLATGGISGAVQQSAEEVFGAMSPAEQTRVRRVLLRLVTIDGDTVTRRRMPLGELAGEGSDLVLLQPFSDARLLTVDEDVVQVTHEALLTVWTRFREWIDADRAWFVNHRVLTQAVGVWVESGRDASALLGASRLGFYDELLGSGDRIEDLNKVEREFLSSSRVRLQEEDEVNRRRARTRRRLVGALAAATVVAVVLAVTAFVARSDALDEREAADAARAQAESRQIVAQALAFRDRDPAIAAQLAVAAYVKSPTFEARSTVLDSTGVDMPLRVTGDTGSAVVATSADRPVAAVGHPSGSIDLYSTTTGLEMVGSLSVRNELPVYVLAFGPGGSVVAAATLTSVELVDVRDISNPVRMWVQPLINSVRSLAFSPDGRTLAVGTAGEDVLRFDLDNVGAPVSSLALPSSSSTVATYSPDGRFLVAAGSGRSLRIWNVNADVPPVVDTATDGTTYGYLSIDFAPNGRALAAGTTGREIMRWDARTDGTLVQTAPLTGFRGYVNTVSFSADGGLLAGGSGDLTTRVWSTADVTAGSVTLPGPASVTSLQFESASGDLVTGDEAGTVRRWPFPGPELTAAGDTLFTNPADESGKTLIGGTGVRAPGAQLWDVADVDRPILAPTRLGSTSGARMTGASALSRDGQVGAVGTDVGGFQLWDTTDTSNPRPLGSTDSAASTLTASLAFDRTADLLAASGQNASDVSLWSVKDRRSPTRISSFDVLGLPAVITFSPTDDLLAVATSASEVELWRTTDATVPSRIGTLRGFGSNATSVAISRDGSLLAAGGSDNSVRLWNVADPLQPLPLGTVGTTSAVTSVSFSPDGTVLAVGLDSSGGLLLVDVADGRDPTVFATLTAARSGINDPAFLAGGDVVAGGGENGRVHLWRTNIDDAVDYLCDRSGSAITEDEWFVLVPGVAYFSPC